MAANVVSGHRADARPTPRRADLGDFSRGIVFFAAFVGYGIGSLTVAGLVIWLIAR